MLDAGSAHQPGSRRRRTGIAQAQFVSFFNAETQSRPPSQPRRDAEFFKTPTFPGASIGFELPELPQAMNDYGRGRVALRLLFGPSDARP